MLNTSQELGSLIHLSLVCKMKNCLQLYVH